jgi:copper ion binding protein
MAKSRYIIHGMTCQNCVRHVQKTLSKLEGATVVTVSLEEKSAEVEWTATAPGNDIVKAAIEDAGYEFKS